MALKHADYTIAWICALSLEMAAAKVMLDEVHPSLPQQKSDHNSYTLGSISGHKVVVACLPSGVYGTTSSAIVLAHMLPTFPCLRFALMVGVGGGVPSKTADIRLGDVVVSMPNATSGGVIQYDYGKTLREGRFQRTGSLNKPPQFLLTVISQMRGNHMTGERPMAEILSNTLQKHQEIREQFSRPDRDWLFSSDYNHDSSDPDCSTCDRTQLVYREPRVTEEPHIHYGLIASGNQVIKHAKTRDFIAQEMGILCFEMEAAGLMDQLPCLVIRGICDYCDSHKHKNWQAYAALVAAAYARTLLMAVPAHENTGDAVTEQNCEQHHWMVPFQKNWRFAGREKEIAKLEGLIEQLNGASRVAISGLGGIGKTQITLELAYRIRERDSSCSIFWIPCTSYESVKQAYISIAQTVGIQEVKPAEAKERVRIYLSQESAGKWLLIFDSADDIDMWINDSQTTPALKKFLPQSKQGHILFTTRNRIDQSDQNSASVILLEQLAYLPLAITQATAYINENQICISTYIKLLKKQESHVIELLSEGFEDEGRLFCLSLYLIMRE
ncbi:hypothetical protein EYZ11_012869 [Aspergillus tanneri]|uniref:Nucleoside phosphorylase domain-containing protein n=1 Tax=Aspergillus tanneri TaxID=1220188 RepID=A0A4S3J191_9EURO|nr:hypothetical protein EYZ11_012869 [Aspergillus tanneri]